MTGAPPPPVHPASCSSQKRVGPTQGDQRFKHSSPSTRAHPPTGLGFLTAVSELLAPILDSLEQTVTSAPPVLQNNEHVYLLALTGEGGCKQRSGRSLSSTHPGVLLRAQPCVRPGAFFRPCWVAAERPQGAGDPGPSGRFLTSCRSRTQRIKGSFPGSWRRTRTR